jgi:hypothetical protein
VIVSAHCDERTRARPATRTDRNIVRLRPFDEVGDDQEVARELHRLDDVEFVFQPLVIFAALVPLAHALLAYPLLEALTRLATQFIGFGGHRFLVADALGGREARQDRLAIFRVVGTAPRDLDGVLDRLGQIGKECDHLGFWLQPVIGSQLPAVVDRQKRALRDGDQGVMCLEIVGLEKERLVGRDQRNEMPVGQVDASLLDRAVISLVTLQFDIQAVSVDILEGQ